MNLSQSFSGLKQHDFSGLRNSEVLLPVRLAGLKIPVSILGVSWLGQVGLSTSLPHPQIALLLHVVRLGLLTTLAWRWSELS